MSAWIRSYGSENARGTVLFRKNPIVMLIPRVLRFSTDLLCLLSHVAGGSAVSLVINELRFS